MRGSPSCSDAGDVLRPAGRGRVFVSLCGNDAVLTARSQVHGGPRRFGRRGRLIPLWQLPVPRVQPVERHNEVDGGGGDDSAAGDEDVEVLTRPVDQDACSNENKGKKQKISISTLPEKFLFFLSSKGFWKGLNVEFRIYLFNLLLFFHFFIYTILICHIYIYI